MTAIAVLGAGSWGTTLANLLAAKGETVRLWAYEPEVVEAINRGHENPLFLPGVRLQPGLRAYGNAREAIAGAPVIVSAAPSHAVRSVIGKLAGSVKPNTLVVSATKGIETDTLALMSAVFQECLPQVRFAALSGPSCRGEPVERAVLRNRRYVVNRAFVLPMRSRSAFRWTSRAGPPTKGGWPGRGDGRSTRTARRER